MVRMSTTAWFILIGCLMLARGLGADRIARLPLTSAMAYLGVGLLLGPMFLGMFAFDLLQQAPLLATLTEIAVLISLFSAGVKMPVPFSLARIPQGGEVLGNLAAGGKGVAQPLTERDRFIAEPLGPIPFSRGLLLVGLDVIGDSLTEINVTSPTCFQAIFDQTGFDVAAMFVQALEQSLKG